MYNVLFPRSCCYGETFSTMTVESFHDYDGHVHPFTLILFHASKRSHTGKTERHIYRCPIAPPLSFCQGSPQSGGLMNTTQIRSVLCLRWFLVGSGVR